MCVLLSLLVCYDVSVVLHLRIFFKAECGIRYLVRFRGFENVYKRQVIFFFFQAEDGIRDLVRSRGLGDVYKRQVEDGAVSIHTCGTSGSRCPDDAARTMRGFGIGSTEEVLSLIHI